MPPGSIAISVADDIVNYKGAVSDNYLLVLAEDIPGVKKMRDRLAWIEPN